MFVLAVIASRHHRRCYSRFVVSSSSRLSRSSVVVIAGIIAGIVVIVITAGIGVVAVIGVAGGIAGGIAGGRAVGRPSRVSCVATNKIDCRLLILLRYFLLDFCACGVL